MYSMSSFDFSAKEGATIINSNTSIKFNEDGKFTFGNTHF